MKNIKKSMTDYKCELILSKILLETSDSYKVQVHVQVDCCSNFKTNTTPKNSNFKNLEKGLFCYD